MTREEAIKWMEETIQDAEEFFDKCSPELREDVLKQNEVFKIAITALRSMQETTKPGWISVKERLPKDFDQALVYDGDKHYPIGICHKGESGIWHSDMAYGMGTITHWMPLPEPPEEG